jgi:uncharacterized membrane protein YfcA
MIRVFFLLLIFWAMQTFAAIMFKYGSNRQSSHRYRWFIGFISGNGIGMTSMWLCMLVYAALPTNPNIAAAATGGGAFVISQVVLAVVFHSKLSWLQWTGITLTALGLILAGWNSTANL